MRSGTGSGYFSDYMAAPPAGLLRKPVVRPPQTFGAVMMSNPYRNGGEVVETRVAYPYAFPQVEPPPQLPPAPEMDRRHHTNTSSSLSAHEIAVSLGQTIIATTVGADEVQRRREGLVSVRRPPGS